MTRILKIVPVFVEFMPSQLQSGELYISLVYSVTAHLCACGCGEKVVLPLHPEQWRFTYDGASISMYPSVGNISTDCNSHYWIENNRIKLAPSISKEQARRGIARDRDDLAERATAYVDPQLSPPVSRKGFLADLLRCFRSNDKSR